jgi:hypothetical protein
MGCWFMGIVGGILRCGTLMFFVLLLSVMGKLTDNYQVPRYAVHIKPASR